MSILPYVLPTIALTGIEILLGIDNVVILTILSSKVKECHRRMVCTSGLFLALILRIALLNGIFILSAMNKIVFAFGGIFLIWKGLSELFELYKAEKEPKEEIMIWDSMLMIALNIAFFDVLFSFDSMITAIGVSTNIIAMSLAIVCSFVLVMIASDYLTKLINRSPKIKIAALALVVAVGYKLIMQGI